MTIKKIVKLCFKSPLHIGKGLGDYYNTSERVLHSDTISGAILAMYAQQSEAIDICEFHKHYKVSSAFPYFDNYLFLPKPLENLNFSISGIESYSQKKKLKAIEYIEINLLSDLLVGSVNSVYSDQISSDGRFLFPKKETNQKFIASTIQQRIMVPRNADVTVPFIIERSFFSENSGLYFFLECEKEKESIIIELIRMLGEIGIGTDKSVGNGQFIPEFSDSKLIANPQSKKTMLLSLFCPLKEELDQIDLAKSFYQLVKRGGFIAGSSFDKFRHLRKKSIFMFTEGSIFERNTFVGKIINIRPDWNDNDLHPVYRDGRAFWFNF